MATIPFDLVILQHEAGKRELTLSEFMALPLSERIRHILTRDLAFFSGGIPVERSLALQRLNDWRSQSP